MSSKRTRCHAHLVLVHDIVMQPARVQPQAGACGHATRAAPTLPRARARAPVLHQQLRHKQRYQGCRINLPDETRRCLSAGDALEADPCNHAPCAAPALPPVLAQAPVLHQQLRRKHSPRHCRFTQSNCGGVLFMCVSASSRQVTTATHPAQHLRCLASTSTSTSISPPQRLEAGFARMVKPQRVDSMKQATVSQRRYTAVGRFLQLGAPGAACTALRATSGHLTTPACQRRTLVRQKHKVQWCQALRLTVRSV